MGSKNFSRITRKKQMADAKANAPEQQKRVRMRTPLVKCKKVVVSNAEVRKTLRANGDRRSTAHYYRKILELMKS